MRDKQTAIAAVVFASGLASLAIGFGYFAYSGFVSGKVAVIAKYVPGSYAVGTFAYFVSVAYLLFAIALLFCSAALLSNKNGDTLMKRFKIFTILSGIALLLGAIVKVALQ